MSDPETTAAEILSGLRDWRAQHPHATFREIETAVEERLARLRVALLQQAAHTSPSAAWSSPRSPHAPVAGPWRAGRHSDPPIRHLPHLRRGAFPPSMRS
jgi:hypothetical protein